MSRISNAVQDRFWRNVTGDGHETCWLWTAGRNGVNGYGQFRVGPKRVPAHCFAWQTFYGPVPPGLELDHTCRVRRCVNPWHLDPVTHQVNVRRGLAVKTHCPADHPYDEANTYLNNGKRHCRACISARYRARRSQRKSVSA